MHTDLQLPRGGWTTPLIALAAGFTAVCIIYLPDIGHGFIRDDFMWIRVGHIGSFSDVARLLSTQVGFYRPLVLASFGLNEALFGLASFPYGLTNLLLLFAAAALLVRLARALQLTPTGAVAAALIWVLNFHAVSMALLWLSGRTALLLSVFGLLAALAAVAGRQWRAAAWCLLALLSKEEAIVLPFVLAAWTWYSAEADEASPLRRAVRLTWPLFGALAAYAALRVHSGAFGPATAPPYYRFTISAPLLVRNVGEYLDRACTLSVAVVLIVLAAARRKPSLNAAESRACIFGGLWLVSGFALTLFLPVRSDLYALSPSLGAALAAGAVAQSLERAARGPTRRALAILVVLPFLLVPVYRQRNARWVAPANVSAQTVAGLRRDASRLADGTHVVFVDRGADGHPFRNAFGDVLEDALAVVVGRGFTGEIVDAADAVRTAGPHEVVYTIRAGTLERIEAASR